jgi:hypothetical protein
MLLLSYQRLCAPRYIDLIPTIRIAAVGDR